MSELKQVAEDLEALIEEVPESSRGFGKSLIESYKKYGSWSPKQESWAKKLLRAAILDEDKPSISISQSEKIFSLFESAHQTIKYPKITFKYHSLKFQLTRAGKKAKVPGSLNITDGGKYGNNIWYGRVLPSGVLDVAAKFSDDEEVVDTLQQMLNTLARNPSKFTGSMGKELGKCCFCNLELSDEKSVSAGYGPVCASNWGLPWG